MSSQTALPPIYRLLGELLDYPTPALADQVRDCMARLQAAEVGGTDRLQEFLDFVNQTDPGRLEEIYTAAFDLNPACYIFAGYILFGESFDRGKFLVRLQERYRQRGFAWGRELADHVPVILRFMGQLDPAEELAQNLAAKCLLPVVRQMNSYFDANHTGPANPYAAVLQTTRLVLESQVPPELVEVETPRPDRLGRQPFLAQPLVQVGDGPGAA